MDGYSIEITGLQELVNKLQGAVKEDVITRSLDLGGILLAGWSKRNRLSGPRPQFLGVRTGRLRSSIASSKTQKSGNIYFTKIGTNVNYAPVHEFGSFSRNIPARPFLKPSLDDEGNRSQILNILTKNINEALEKK